VTPTDAALNAATTTGHAGPATVGNEESHALRRVVLAYSGGLDTSVCIPWLRERYGCEVVALHVNVGKEAPLDQLRRRARLAGASQFIAMDVRERFAREFIWPALQANAAYQGQYPLSAALSRPLMAAVLAETAARVGADAVAHGCTGKGNDQVRFDVSVAALAPGLKVLAPVRDWPLSREEELEFARRRGIDVPLTASSPYSIDANIWGRSIECGPLEDPWCEPPEDAFTMTTAPEGAPPEPGLVDIDFQAGVPVRLNGTTLGPHCLLDRLNRLAGAHGVGRLDMIEDRLVGIKSREVYEAPGAVALLTAHREMECLTLPREVLAFKPAVEHKLAELIYTGLWFSPLRAALSAFVSETQRAVTGRVRLKLYRGSCRVIGRRSPLALYDRGLATYAPGDEFDHTASAGFIHLWGLSTRVAAARDARAGQGSAPTARQGGDEEGAAQ